MRGAEQGFTLLEVMVAVLLLALGYVAALESFSSSLRRLGGDESKRELFLAEEVLFSRTLRFSPLTGSTAAESMAEGETFLLGQHYAVEKVQSENGLLHSLKLVALP